ncbi:MAG TPA: hypothetical protein VGN20_08500 [Mucilaginibacter sp.]|jgi:hypothetical protein
MQPLRAFDNVQKAKLLHALFYQEIPAFLKYTTEMCAYMKDNPGKVREVWKDQLFSVEFWFQLSEEANRKIKQYSKQLEKSSSVFADQLFDGYGALFLNHCLTTYAEKGQPADPKFKLAVALFINP